MVSEEMFENDDIHTDQPKKKSFFSRFAAEHPLREIIFFAEQNKNQLFRRGVSPRKFAEKLREISRWVGKDLRFLHADNEDSDQMEKPSECPA